MLTFWMLNFYMITFCNIYIVLIFQPPARLEEPHIPILHHQVDRSGRELLNLLTGSLVRKHKFLFDRN